MLVHSKHCYTKIFNLFLGKRGNDIFFYRVGMNMIIKFCQFAFGIPFSCLFSSDFNRWNSFTKYNSNSMEIQLANLKAIS